MLFNMIIGALVAASLVTTALCRGLTRNEDVAFCTEPDDDLLRLNFENDVHESFLLLETNNHRHPIDIERFKSIKRSHLRGDNTTCSTVENGANSGHVSETSLCRWHHVLNFDANRRPMTLVEAKCNCNRRHNCSADIEGSRCQPVHYYVRVLRKAGCDRTTGKYVYRYAVEPIVIGCTCVVES